MVQNDHGAKQQATFKSSDNKEREGAEGKFEAIKGLKNGRFLAKTRESMCIASML